MTEPLTFIPTHDIPLVYHFSGGPLPKYGYRSLSEAAKRWSGPVVLLHDRDLAKPVANAQVDNFLSWYNPDPFASWAKNSEMQLDFRNGFWFHAIERFFVLDQWFRNSSYKHFLHCELDVAVMNSDLLVTTLQKLKPGIYYPRASKLNAGANWLFSNSPAALAALVAYLTENSGREFEMPLLAQFLDDFPQISAAAPSHYSFENPSPGFSFLEARRLREWGGLVDVHPIGTWILGHDPRNVVSEPVFNHFYYEGIGSPTVASLRVLFLWKTRSLWIEDIDGVRWPLFALHVHSKRIEIGYSSLRLAIYVLLARLPWRTVIIGQHWGKWGIGKIKKLVDECYLGLKKLRPGRLDD